MDSLAKRRDRRDIRRALQNLPKAPDDTYKEAMRRIESQDKDDVKLAKRVLSWISFAMRPLTTTEIQHALAVEPKDVDIDEEVLLDKDILVSVCAGLVIIDQESNIIRLVHYTAQEYFERIHMAWFPDGQMSIATTCLTYMSFDVIAKGYCHSDQEMEMQLHEYPLLEYVARYWGDHARGGPEKSTKELALTFLTHNPKLMCSNQVIHLPKHRYSGYSQRFPKGVAELQIVASFGLAEIVRPLLEMGADVAMRDDEGRTALYEAARNGHETVVQLLLEKGADINAKNEYGNAVLHRAAERGHEAVVRLLVEKGADVNVKDYGDWEHHGGTALHRVAGRGHEAVARLLVEKGADVNVTNSHGWTALHRAADKGHETMVRLLVEKGADVNAKDLRGWTTLHQAVSKGHETVVRLLVEKGADVNVKDWRGWTTLHQAAEKRGEAVVQLLEKGANPCIKP